MKSLQLVKNGVSPFDSRPLANPERREK